MDNETIHVADATSFPDVADAEHITVTDQVSIQVLNATTTSISVGGGTVYGPALTATFSVSSLTAAVTGSVTLSVDGRVTEMTLSGGSATFNLGVLKVASHTLVASYSAQGSFIGSLAKTVFTISKATPAITWATPAAITYGTALSGTQLNATTSVAGTFAYTPTAGTVLGAGSRTLSVTFTPTDTTDYTSATATVTLQVKKATPAITWPNPAAITYGTPLSGTQLNATASVPGTFVYTLQAGTVLSAGSQNLSVTFTPSDTTDDAIATATVTLQVKQVTPLITWPNPGAITYGTALSSKQLNAAASVPGTFVYAPPSGTVLSAGSQTLSVTFAPSDSTDYTKATATVTLQVVCGALINLSSSSVLVGGTVTVAANVVSCPSTKQTVVIQFLLSGPAQPNTCSSTKSVMFTTPPFTLDPKTSQTVSFPFNVPSGVWPGTYSITATTHANSASGTVLNTSRVSLTITAH